MRGAKRAPCKLPFVVVHPRKQYVTYIRGRLRTRAYTLVTCDTELSSRRRFRDFFDSHFRAFDSECVTIIHAYPAKDSVEKFELPNQRRDRGKLRSGIKYFRFLEKIYLGKI